MDTIHIKYDRDNSGSRNFFRVFARLPVTDLQTPLYDSAGNLISLKGKIKNLRIAAYQDRLTIKGSFSRYLKGDNIYPLKPNELKDIIDDFKRHSLFPFEKGKITRIDFGMTFSMNNPVPEYLPLLTSKPGMYSNLSKNQLLFSNSTKQLAFYDKLKEITRRKNHGATLAKLTNSFNLRYEFRLLKKPNEALGIPYLNIEHFFDRKNYDGLIQLWKDEYKSIRKLHPTFYDLKISNPPTSIYNQLIALGIQRFGEKEFYDGLDYAALTGRLSRKAKSDIIAKTTNILSTPTFMRKPLFELEELDDNILTYH